MMKRFSLVLLAACAAGISSATIVFSDGFETGDFSKWFVGAGSGDLPTISTDTARVRSGAHSAHVIGPASGSGGGRYMADFNPLGQPLVRLSAWMYDPLGPGGTGRQWMELRSMTGTTVNNIWAIGWTNAVTGGGGLYTARISHGTGAPSWFNLVATRKAGWRHFQIEVDQTHARFYVDGVLDSSRLRFADGTVNRVVLNSGHSSAGYQAWVDDVSVEAVPEPASLLALGAGALALLRRRRKR